MISQEFFEIPVEQDFYVVVMSNPYKMSNPFLRHIGTIKTTNYRKPLGIFKTHKIRVENEHQWNWTMHKAFIDYSEFKDLIWFGRYDEIPGNKTLMDYAEHSLTYRIERGVSVMIYDEGSGEKNPHDSFTYCFFLTADEALEFSNKQKKAFSKNMKQYLAHLQNEIDCANKNIEEAKNQIEEYSKFI